MKAYFVTGLALLLPLVLTIIIVLFVMRFLTQPFMGIFENALHYYAVQLPDFWFISGWRILHSICQMFVLLFLFILALATGTIAESFFFKKFVNCTSWIIYKIPMINKIYKACHDAVKTLLQPQTHSFGTVVLVPFPHKGIWSLGLVTQEALKGELKNQKDVDLISVFLPTTPNPTMGFMLLFPRSEILPTNLTIEEAFRSVISCGLMLPQIQINKQEAVS